MHQDSYSFGIETATKFHRCLRLTGWYTHQDDVLVGVTVTGADLAGSVCTIEFLDDPSGEGVRQQFWVEVLTQEEGLTPELRLVLRTRRGWVDAPLITELIAEREQAEPLYAMWNRFRQSVIDLPAATVLEIGGRDRSGSGHRRVFGDHPSVVVDIVQAPGVDVVGDAHDLSAHFPPERFEAFLAVSVFEHLLMPWRVVLELNRVLKDGALGYVSTHQALALHDMPWDFWRFSETSWDALFNARTGFEVVERLMSHKQYLLPFLCRPGKEDSERAVGFEASAVIVRKIGPTDLSWPVSVDELTSTTYPTA